MKKNYITIAKSLGIVLPACLMTSSVEANATNVDNGNIVIIQKEIMQKTQLASNPVKDRIVKCYNSESTISPYQIDHTNVHANYNVSHTNVHTNYRYSGGHTDTHSNTPAYHVNDHSNSAA